MPNCYSATTNISDNDSIRHILRAVELCRRLCLTSILALLVQRRLCLFGHAARRPDGELINDLLLPHVAQAN